MDKDLMMASTSPSPRWLRFSLRASLIAFTLIAIVLAWSAPTLRNIFQQKPVLKLSPVPGEDAFELPPHYVRAIDALKNKNIRPDMSIEELFAVSAPDHMVTLGRYSECYFTGVVGYQGLNIIAKDDRLVRAVDSGCIYDNKYFDEMTAKDHNEYQRLVEARYAAEKGLAAQP